MSEARNTEWIASVEERLRWFMEEATDEEFDEEEVDTLVSLLNRLKPLGAVEQKNDNEVLEDFFEYVKVHEAEEKGVTVNGKLSAEKKVRSHKFATIAAAILLLVIVAGGSIGVANANKENGFFYWLQKDDEGMTMLTSPEDMDGEKDVEYTEQYYAIEEVPEEYLSYIVEQSQVSQLEDYELQVVTINKANTYFRVKQWFANESEEKNVCIGALIYENDIRLARDSHLSEQVQIIETDEKLEDGILVRESKIGLDENKILFYVNNCKYFVEGNIEVDTLIQIAETYRDMILNP